MFARAVLFRERTSAGPSVRGSCVANRGRLISYYLWTIAGPDVADFDLAQIQLPRAPLAFPYWPFLVARSPSASASLRHS